MSGIPTVGAVANGTLFPFVVETGSGRSVTSVGRFGTR
jgi:hypothetical protein